MDSFQMAFCNSILQEKGMQTVNDSGYVTPSSVTPTSFSGESFAQLSMNQSCFHAQKSYDSGIENTSLYTPSTSGSGPSLSMSKCAGIYSKQTKKGIMTRQNAVSDDIMHSCIVERQERSVSDECACVTRGLKKLVVDDNVLKTICTCKNTYIDSSRFSFSTTKSFGSIENNWNVDNLICCTNAVSGRCTSVSLPITPRKPKRGWSPGREGNDVLLRTPLSDNRCSDIMNTHSGQKAVKRLNFNSQKLGTPEKNKILYSELKHVTPPKRLKMMKSNEKYVSVPGPKCKKLARKYFDGIEQIDFFKGLTGHLPAIKLILGYLSDEDLSSASKVSPTWHNVVHNVPEAVRRQKNYKKQRECAKENAKSLDYYAKAELVPGQSIARKQLMEIQNHRNVLPATTSTARSPPTSPSSRQHRIFRKAASEDSGGELRRCPQCNRPARLHGKLASCEGRSCGFTFCAVCLEERKVGIPCCQRPIKAPSPSKQMPAKIYIGTKKSRRNLRRL